MHGADADIFTASMYLAKDCILCWKLVSKRGGSWILHDMKSAYAEMDAPDTVPELNVVAGLTDLSSRSHYSSPGASGYQTDADQWHDRRFTVQ